MHFDTNTKQFFLFAITVFIIIVGFILVTFLFLLRPLHPTDELSSAQKKYKSEDYRGAVTELTQIISNNPKDIKAYIIRGRAKLELGDKFGAIRDLTYAIELDPLNSDAYFQRGFILHDIDSLKSAYQDYTKCISLFIKASPAYHNRAIILRKWGMYSEALEDYNNSILYSPDDTLAYINRGKLKLFNLNDKEGGCLDLSRAGELGSRQAYGLIKEHCN